MHLASLSEIKSAPQKGPLDSRLIASWDGQRLTVRSPPRGFTGRCVLGFGPAAIIMGFMIWGAIVGRPGPGMHESEVLWSLGLVSLLPVGIVAVTISDAVDTFSFALDGESLVYFHRYLVRRRTRSWRKSEITRFRVLRNEYRSSPCYGFRISLISPRRAFEVFGNRPYEELEWLAKIFAEVMDVPAEISSEDHF